MRPVSFDRQKGVCEDRDAGIIANPVIRMTRRQDREAAKNDFC